MFSLAFLIIPCWETECQRDVLLLTGIIVPLIFNLIIYCKREASRIQRPLGNYRTGNRFLGVGEQLRLRRPTHPRSHRFAYMPDHRELETQTLVMHRASPSQLPRGAPALRPVADLLSASPPPIRVIQRSAQSDFSHFCSVSTRVYNDGGLSRLLGA